MDDVGAVPTACCAGWLRLEDGIPLRTPKTTGDGDRTRSAPAIPAKTGEAA